MVGLCTDYSCTCPLHRAEETARALQQAWENGMEIDPEHSSFGWFTFRRRFDPVEENKRIDAVWAW